MPLPSLVLSSPGLSSDGTSLYVQDNTVYPTPQDRAAVALLVVVYRFDSREDKASVTPLPYNPLTATRLTIPLPQDGVYGYTGALVEAQTGVEVSTGDPGQYRYDTDLLTFFYTPDGTRWMPQASPPEGIEALLLPEVKVLHLTHTSTTRNSLVLQLLQQEGPGMPPGRNTPAQLRLQDFLHRTENTLTGAAYLYQLGNYAQCAYVLERFAAQRYAVSRS